MITLANKTTNKCLRRQLSNTMAKTRALLTETEREQIADEHGDERRYQATSRVRRRIEDELTTDVEVLREHHPGLLAEVQEIVCDNTD